jgi:DNA modification methylase
MQNHPLPRLDQTPELRTLLSRHCRLRPGDIWCDPEGRHTIGCIDAADGDDIRRFMDGRVAQLAVHDPPYNLVAFDRRNIGEFVEWCRTWVENTHAVLSKNSSLYVWMGADQTEGFQPLPDFMIMMRATGFRPRSFVTMRNQRGYGTQKNWMAVRQELLYYVKGEPGFNVEAEYTDIPKVLRGYYKDVNGKLTENMERSKSGTIRAGNVWIDVQQVFYRMEENVNGCYAQKPLKSCERIISASSNPGDLVIDFFAHSGATMISSEMLGRKCATIDNDPLYCEIAIRRLELLRQTGRTGWQNSNPFASEIANDPALQRILCEQGGSNGSAAPNRKEKPDEAAQQALFS